MRVLFYLLNYHAAPLAEVRQWHFANAKILFEGSEPNRFKVSSRVMQMFGVFCLLFCRLIQLLAVIWQTAKRAIERKIEEDGEKGRRG